MVLRTGLGLGRSLARSSSHAHPRQRSVGIFFDGKTMIFMKNQEQIKLQSDITYDFNLIAGEELALREKMPEEEEEA